LTTLRVESRQSNRPWCCSRWWLGWAQETVF